MPNPDWCSKGAAGASKDGAETGQEGGQDQRQLWPQATDVSLKVKKIKRQAVDIKAYNNEWEKS